MQDKDILEGNKMISEFDGVTFEIADLANYPEGRHEWFVKWPNGTCFKKYGTIEDAIRLCDLKYHSSWDYIKPIVDKIAILGMEEIQPCHPDLNKKAGEVATIQICCSIETVWMAVVQFIQWYNSHQK